MSDAPTGRETDALDPPELHREVFEQNRTVQLLIEPESGRIIDGNQAACQFYGYARAELTALTIHDINTLPRAEVARAMAQAEAQRKNAFAFRHRLASGEIRDVEVHSGPVDVGGRRLLYSVIQDVTERRRGEEELQRAMELLRRSEEKHRAILESIEEGYYELDRGGALTLVNDALCRITGYPREELLGKRHTDLTDAETAARLEEAFSAAAHSGRALKSLEWTLRRKDATSVHVAASATVVRDAGGAAIGLRGVVRDVTERQQAEDALRESEARFRTLADTAPCAIVIYQGRRFLYANAATVAISGYTREDLEHMSFWDMVHPEFRDLVRERGAARQRGEPIPNRYEFKILTKHGEERWVDFSAGTIEYGGEAAALGTGFDITERKRVEEQIKEIAYHDALTGLPNRLLFNDRLQVAVAQAHRQRQRLAVLFLDVDRFKVINDSLGHTLGDRLLQSVARRLADCIREGDTVARLGGDEFTLLLPGMARAEDVAKLAEKILEALRRPFAFDGRELFVTASIGISLYPDDGGDPEALVKNADTAMYRAKEQGRDTYQLFTAAMNATAMERLALEHGLRRALPQNELELHYQPIVDVASGHVHGVEALLRWRHSELGLVTPTEFVPLAELTGLVVPIGAWVLRTACRQAAEWQKRVAPGLSVAVNLSARQLQQPDLVAVLTRVLDESGLDPRYLDLEITESHTMQSADATAETLRRIKALGVRISIDDFGIGYSSLAYLKRLPIDTLKIDQSFVRDITTDPEDATIVTAVIALAQTLRLVVVAEGVETQEQLAFLAARRCDRMQGFLFSRALPPSECSDLLLRERTRRV